MIKSAILHIGAPKTGTSIIQSHMAQNREILRDKGYLYPVTISADKSLYRTYESHHLLTYSWAGWEPFNRFDPAAFWERVKLTAEEQGLHTLLLSAENTYWLPRQLVAHEKPTEQEFWAGKEAYVKRIHKDLAQFDTKIIIYLRRQDRWIESWYNQQVKNGNSFSKNIMDFADHHHYLLDYAALLDRWANKFGHQNIIVRPYEKEQLKDGLLEDFLKTTGIGTSNEFPLRSKGRHNAQLSRETLEFMNICNQLPLQPEDKHWLRILIRRITNQFESEAKFLNQELLSPLNRISILEKYEPTNQRIAREYMGISNGVLFKEAWPSPSDKWETFPGLDSTFLIEMLMEIILNLRNSEKTSDSQPSKGSGKALYNLIEQNQKDFEFWNEHLWDYR